MLETEEGKGACTIYAERVEKLRSEVSGILGRQLRLERSIGDDGIIDAKLLDPRRVEKPEHEVFRIRLDTTKPENFCRAEVDWSGIPEIEKYELAKISRSRKFRMSGHRILNMVLFRKERELMRRITNAVINTMAPYGNATKTKQA